MVKQNKFNSLHKSTTDATQNDKERFFYDIAQYAPMLSDIVYAVYIILFVYPLFFYLNNDLSKVVDKTIFSKKKKSFL